HESCFALVVAERTNERAVGIERKGRDIGIEVRRLATFEEVLLDVGSVEGAYLSVMILEVLPHRLDRFVPAKISAQRNEQIPSSEVAQDSVVLLVGEIASILSGSVVGSHEVGIRGIVAARSSSSRIREIHLRPSPNKFRIDVLNAGIAGKICRAQAELMC